MYYVIGLMSGTSMDGINGTLVKTNGRDLCRTSYNIIGNYKKSGEVIRTTNRKF